MMRDRQDIIKSLINLRNKLDEGPSPKVISEAIDANPWFTDSYVNQSCANIASWLSQEVLEKFEDQYSFTSSQKHIGIIAAGNIPLVGFHDVLVGVLSGHLISVKCSHQDKVLMEWIIIEWEKILPSISSFIQIVKKIGQVDYLIATGSNNTSRYLEAGFKNIPKTIRRNRFSVGLLTRDSSEEELRLLAEDVLLHNGLGCRNVSNCIVVADFDLQRWIDTLRNYSHTRLNQAYLKKLDYEKARLITLDKDFIDAGTALIVSSDQFSFGHMGIITLQYASSIEEAYNLIDQNVESIQCVSGLDVKEGQTQWPGLFTFADKVDTPEILCAL